MNWHSGTAGSLFRLHMVPRWHFSCSFEKRGWPPIALCIAVCCKIISYRQAPQPTYIKLAPVVPAHLCCRAAKGLWEPGTSEVCSGIQIACKVLAACRLDCRLVGAVAEENGGFLKTSKNFCSSEFPCFSALYEYSFCS